MHGDAAARACGSSLQRSFAARYSVESLFPDAGIPSYAGVYKAPGNGARPHNVKKVKLLYVAAARQPSVAEWE